MTSPATDRVAGCLLYHRYLGNTAARERLAIGRRNGPPSHKFGKSTRLLSIQAIKSQHYSETGCYKFQHRTVILGHLQCTLHSRSSGGVPMDLLYVSVFNKEISCPYYLDCIRSESRSMYNLTDSSSASSLSSTTANHPPNTTTFTFFVPSALNLTINSSVVPRIWASGRNWPCHSCG